MNKPGGKSGFRRLSGAVAVAAVAALTAAGCGGQPAGSVKQGGVFNLGSDTSIDSLNPFVAFQTDAYTTFDYIYPTLAQYNAKMQLVPDFATSWTVTDGGKIWTFHTVKGAKWSDGKPLTAQDAAWTFATILKYQNGPTANSAGYVAHMASATAPDADTLVLTYKQPVANVLSQVQQVPDPARARLGQVRHRERQGPDDVHQQRAGRVRRPVHPVQVHREAGRPVQAEPDVLRPEAAHQRPGAGVLIPTTTR